MNGHNGVSPRLEHIWRRLFHRPDEAPAGPTFETSHLDRLLRSYRRVVLVLDGPGEPDRVISDFLARVTGVRLELTVLRVLPAWCQQHLEDQVRADLAGVAERFTSSLHQVVGSVRRGESVEQILQAAAEDQAELIVLAVLRRARLHRGLDQSTIAAVVGQSAIPVLMVRGERGEHSSVARAMSHAAIR